MEVLLEAVKSRSCDSADEWAGLQCLVEGGVCEECVVQGLQRFLLNSSASSQRQRAGQLMAKLSDRMVSLDTGARWTLTPSPPLYSHLYMPCWLNS